MNRHAGDGSRTGRRCRRGESGFWAYAAPQSFADVADFQAHSHFLHDLAAFQLGIGFTVLLAVIWADALATALAGFVVTNTLHVANHIADLDIGGQAWHAWALAGLSLLAAVALVLRLRAVGYVVGGVSTATSPALEPFVRQKTIALTTYRRDGGSGSTRSASPSTATGRTCGASRRP